MLQKSKKEKACVSLLWKIGLGMLEILHFTYFLPQMPHF